PRPALPRRRLAHARQQRPAQRLLALHWSARRPCGGCPRRLLGNSALRMTASTGLEVGGLCSATAGRESVEDQAIVLADGRTVGFADYGSPPATAVLWCHGGPGSRVEPAHLRSRAKAAGLRIVGIDRPGYGLSTVQPGRTIGGRGAHALTVADHLGIAQFVTVGTSTGGAYALALAALAPERVAGVIASCSMTDMRWPEGRSTMSRPRTHAVWEAPDRAAALAAAVGAHG